MLLARSTAPLSLHIEHCTAHFQDIETELRKLVVARVDRSSFHSLFLAEHCTMPAADNRAVQSEYLVVGWVHSG
jgi:urate oxidase